MASRHWLVVGAFVLASCGGGGGGGGDSGSAASGTLEMVVAAVNSSPTAHALAAPLPSRALTASTAQVTGGSILSGPPDQMKIYVQQVLLSAKGLVKLYESPTPRGTPITLSNQTIDLAQALGVSPITVPAGTYGSLQLVVSRVGEIAGCITGAFQPPIPFVQMTNVPLQPTILAMAPLHAGNLYSNDPIMDPAPRTFCTQANRSELSVGTYTTSVIGSNASFVSVPPGQVTEVDLDRGNPSNLTAAQLRSSSVTITTPLSFEVKANAPTKLLLAVDLNRMLRYFANTRTDVQPPAPTKKAGTSYFFTSTFLDAMMLAPADGTTIEGYAVDITVDQHTGGTPFVVTEWMTVIRGSNGGVLGGVIIPDDDDALTIAKGNLDPAASVPTGTNTWRIGFQLGTHGAGSLGGFTFLPLNGTGTCTLTPFSNIPSTVTFQVSYRRLL